MALSVEDGTVVIGADALVSLTFANTYHTDRGNSDWTGADAVKEQAIRYATTDIAHGVVWPGYISTSDEDRLPIPRLSWYDRDGRLLTGVPVPVKHAVCELALEHLRDLAINQEAVDRIDGVKIEEAMIGDAVEVTFGERSRFSRFILTLLQSVGARPGGAAKQLERA